MFAQSISHVFQEPFTPASRTLLDRFACFSAFSQLSAVPWKSHEIRGKDTQMKRLFSKGPRRRALFAGSSIALGAATGAVVFAALGGAASGTTATTSQTSSASGSEVASTTPTYNAATIYDKDSPGVVDITVTEAASSQDGQGMSPFAPGGGSGEAKAEGTGFVYDKQGDIVTASHVVSGATAISVRFKDGTTAKATLVGSDPSSDTAVIKVSVSADKLTPLALADSSKVEPG